MVVTTADYGAWRRLLYRGAGKAQLKALPALPNEAQALAIVQAVEDRMTAASAAAKGDIEAVLGQPVSTAFVSEIIKAWALWRVGRM